MLASIGDWRVTYIQRSLAITMLLLFASSTAESDNSERELRVGRAALVVDFNKKCEKRKVNRTELAKNLAQYDPSLDQNSDIRDETPRTRTEIQKIQEQLVKDGFVYPNGKERHYLDGARQRWEM